MRHTKCHDGAVADRFDELIAEIRADRAEFRSEIQRERAEWSSRMDRLQDQTDENLRFLRELNRRGEVALQELVRSQRAMRREIRAETQEIKAATHELTTLTETTKAHTRAIFALIDRLEGGGAGGPAPAT